MVVTREQAKKRQKIWNLEDNISRYNEKIETTELKIEELKDRIKSFKKFKKKYVDELKKIKD